MDAEAVAALAKLSVSEMGEEIARLTKQTIKKNINNPYIQWDQKFVSTYAAKYSPGYVKQLTNKMNSKETKIDTNKLSLSGFSSKAVGRSSKVTRKTYTYSASGAKQFSLKCEVSWQYSNGKVTYLAPYTSINIYNSVWDYYGLTVSQQYLDENDTIGVVYKRAYFINMSTGTYKYPYISIIVRGDGTYSTNSGLY